MALSLQTSQLMQHGRLANNLPQRNIEELELALQTRDFAKFCQLTIRESNQLHAICLDTYPPLNYMNLHSRQITAMCDSLNKDEETVAYSIDAGFHVFLFCLKTNK